MTTLMIVYGGSAPQRVSSLLDEHHAGGYTEFRNAHRLSAGERLHVAVLPTESFF